LSTGQLVTGSFDDHVVVAAVSFTSDKYDDYRNTSGTCDVGRLRPEELGHGLCVAPRRRALPHV